MIKQLILGLTFITAFTLGSVVMTDSAEAWRRGGWGRPYAARYYASPQVYYGRPYGSYYRGGYGPSYYSYPRRYSSGYYGYGYPSNYYYGPRSGVSFSVGF